MNRYEHSANCVHKQQFLNTPFRDRHYRSFRPFFGQQFTQVFEHTARDCQLAVGAGMQPFRPGGFTSGLVGTAAAVELARFQPRNVLPAAVSFTSLSLRGI